jgi:hypothetical protein
MSDLFNLIISDNKSVISSSFGVDSAYQNQKKSQLVYGASDASTRQYWHIAPEFFTTEI